MLINISDIVDSRFKFYLEENFRKQLFQKLKIKCKSWHYVAKNLDINQRALFGLRRGWNIVDENKKERFIRMETLNKMCSILQIDMNSVQRFIHAMEMGSRRESISFPLDVDINTESLGTMKRDITEFVYMKNFIKNLSNSAIICTIDYSKKDIDNQIELLRVSGLKPDIRILDDKYFISYRKPGTNQRCFNILPKRIVLSQDYSKQMGKWIGDRCGGKNCIGISNKVPEFIEEFKLFLEDEFLQHPEKLILSLVHKPGYEPKTWMKNMADYVDICKTQYGNYSFKLRLSNKILKTFTFDKFDKNWFEILYNSGSKIRFAFYAGLFEAEGYADSTSMSWAFGMRPSIHSNDDILRKFEDAIKLKVLLDKDGFDSIVCRKYSKKSDTLKYDVRVLRNSKSRVDEYMLFKEMRQYINHPVKIVELANLENKIMEDKMIDKRLVPEVNIGTLGH